MNPGKCIPHRNHICSTNAITIRFTILLLCIIPVITVPATIAMGLEAVCFFRNKLNGLTAIRFRESSRNYMPSKKKATGINRQLLILPSKTKLAH